MQEWRDLSCDLRKNRKLIIFLRRVEEFFFTRLDFRKKTIFLPNKTIFLPHVLIHQLIVKIKRFCCAKSAHISSVVKVGRSYAIHGLLQWENVHRADWWELWMLQFYWNWWNGQVQYLLSDACLFKKNYKGAATLSAYILFINISALMLAEKAIAIHYK